MSADESGSASGVSTAPSIKRGLYLGPQVSAPNCPHGRTANQSSNSLCRMPLQNPVDKAAAAPLPFTGTGAGLQGPGRPHAAAQPLKRPLTARLHGPAGST